MTNALALYCLGRTQEELTSVFIGWMWWAVRHMDLRSAKPALNQSDQNQHSGIDFKRVDIQILPIA